MCLFVDVFLQDYEQIGRAFCETLLDYSDESPTKVKRQMKIIKQIKKIRKREKREQKALKLKKLAEQECILSDKCRIKRRSKNKSISKGDARQTTHLHPPPPPPHQHHPLAPQLIGDE